MFARGGHMQWRLSVLVFGIGIGPGGQKQFGDPSIRRPVQRDHIAVRVSWIWISPGCKQIRQNLGPIRPGCLVNCRVGVFAVALLNTSPVGKEQLEACQLTLLCREVYRGVAVRAPGIRVGAGIDRCLQCHRVSGQCRCPNGLYLAKRLAKRGAQKHNQDQ